MRRSLLLVPVVVLLAACGSSSAGSGAALPRTGSSAASVVLSADPAACAPTASASPAPAGTASPAPLGSTCTIRVHYSNSTAAPLAIDASLTRVTDSTGSTYLPQPVKGAVTNAVVAPAAQVSVDWTVNLAPGSSLAAVTWIGPAGDSSTVSLKAGASASPVATPSATPKPTPKPTPTATAKPKPTPTPTATKKSTSKPRPATSAPPASGTIG
jgi:hypothetical protein